MRKACDLDSSEFSSEMAIPRTTHLDEVDSKALQMLGYRYRMRLERFRMTHQGSLPLLTIHPESMVG